MKSSPSYHLRANKSVDRLLFIELLKRISNSLPKSIDKYEYVSLGGPYLEDFHLLHQAFGNKKMVSLETDEFVLKRQGINLPNSATTLKLQSTGDFINQFEGGRRPFLIWLDYSNTRWTEQLDEVCTLLTNLSAMSIVKVTLSGNTQHLGGKQSDPFQEKAEKFTEAFSDYGKFSAQDMTKNKICDTLYYVLRRAIQDRIPDTQRLCVRSLGSYKYDDGTPILTVTMMVGPLSKVQDTIAKSRLIDWIYPDINWTGPKLISVPLLSLKERIAVDKLLPKASAKSIVKQLELYLESDYQKSVDALQGYIDFNRHVPQFIRISL